MINVKNAWIWNIKGSDDVDKFNGNKRPEAAIQILGTPEPAKVGVVIIDAWGPLVCHFQLYADDRILFGFYRCRPLCESIIYRV